jgi:hypothetical protein
MSITSRIKDFISFSAPATPIGMIPQRAQNAPGPKNLSNYITPLQLQRLRIDVSMWRTAIKEAEDAYWPHRVKMQQMFIDTILNGHVGALMERRQDLTLLRAFMICDAAGVQNDELTKQFAGFHWLPNFIKYVLDTVFFGYTLISLGDIIQDDFADVNIVRRWNISPDRFQVGRFMYALNGLDWRDPQFVDWHIYVDTPSETGASPCGYGLLYKIALYEIFLRNTLGFNGDFIELYAQPYRVGKTSKTTESERAEFEAAIRNMGSSGWAIVDPMDDISFLETALGGTGWKGYDNLEARCQKTVSKLILGHADAMDSTPGKLGSNQGGDDSPAQRALIDKQTKDGALVETVINRQLLPRMANLGVKFPEGYFFRFKNDAEMAAIRKKEDDSNLNTANIALNMKNAGLQMAPEYFQERTGIPTSKIIVPPPAPPLDPNKDVTKELAAKETVKNKLKKLYRK